ncbi:MAG: malectin domain-containing carbohydrate-binding protein [Spirochaetales bacterium]
MTAWINISADDGPLGSGVQRIEVRIDGGEPTEYDAPIALGRATRRTVEFRAVDRAGRTSDWSTLWVQPSSSDDPTEHLVTAINAGGGAYQSMEGVPFEADRHYIGGKGSQKGNAQVANTYDDPLYQSYRTGTVYYEIPVQNGNYRVRLHFAEMYHTESGQRVMDVRVEDEVVDSALDVYSDAGYRAALILEARVRVTDGSLKVEARGIEKHPNISAIVVERDDPMRGTLYAINAGGSAAVDPEGIRYNADSHYTGGQRQTADESENSTLDSLRVGTFRYSLPVENGTYQVILTTAVDEAAERGQNIYTVRAEHEVPLQSIDLASEYVGQASAQHRFHVDVTDGILNLSFEPEQGHASLSAIQIREADPMADVAYAINIGGGAYVASDGIRYAPDAYHQGGKTNRRPRDIANTIDDILYHTYRGGTFRYELPVANGVYEVEFHFDENFFHEEGQRAFDVRTEHHLVYNNLDVVAETGRKSAALVMRYQVVVRDGALSLHFIADRKDAIASAIVVRRGDPMFDVHHAVNLGGERFRNADGVIFAADTEQTSLGPDPVEATYDDKLFQTGRIGATVVTVELAPGPYHVSLGAVAPPVQPDGDSSATITATADGKPLFQGRSLTPKTAVSGSAELLLHDGELSVDVETDRAASTFLLVRTGDPMTGVHHAINAGGGSYLAINGIRFEPDKHYEGGKEADRRNSIAGTEDDAIYQSWRSGSSTYTLPVTPGHYEVELHFAETYFSEAGQREFSVAVAGQLVEVDIAGAVGRNAAHVLSIPVETQEEQIVISVQSGRRDASISAIVVREAE